LSDPTEPDAPPPPPDQPPPTGLLKRLSQSVFFKNLASLSGATLFTKAIGVAILGWAARHLGPEGYGIVGFGLSISAYAAILLSPGLMTWGVREVARERESAGRLVVIINGTQTVLATLGIVGTAVFAYGWLENPVERNVVILSSLVLITQGLSVNWALNGLELIRVNAGIDVIYSVGNALGLVLFVRQPDDIYAMPILALVLATARTAAGYPILLMAIGKRLQWPTRQQVFTALWASLPLGVMSAIHVVLHYTNNLIIRGYMGPAELGEYLAGFRLVELAATIPTVLSGAFFPRLARSAKESPEKAAQEAQLFAKVHMVPAFFGAVMMLVEAQGVVDLLYGAAYQDAVILVQIMSLALFFNFAICGYSNCLLGFGKDRVMLVVLCASAITSIGGGFALVPIYGALGGAIAIAAVDLAGWLVSLPTYRREIGPLNLQSWFKPAVGAAFVGAVCLGLQHYNVPFLVRLPLAFLAYTPTLYLEGRSTMMALK